MVKVNGKNFIVYDMDTLQTIINRIASRLETIPKYLYFKDGLPDIEVFKTGNNIEVEDILSILKNFSNKSTKFTTLYENMVDKIQQQNLDLKNDILVPFIIYNNTLANNPKQFQDAFILVYQDEINKSPLFDDNIDIKNIWENRVQSIESINAQIKTTTKEASQQQDMFRKITDADVIPYTPFEVEKLDFKILINMGDISIIELFNYIQLSPKIPYAFVNNFYKILKDFTPFKEWAFNSELINNAESDLFNVIILKTLQTKQSSNNITDYSDIFITYPSNDDTDNKSFVINTYLYTSGKPLSLQNYIQNILSIFPTFDFNPLQPVKEEGISGVFYFPNFRLNKYVLADLILNDPLFSSLLAIDESNKATKTKNNIYIYFKSTKLGYITANLTNKIAEKGDPTLKNKDITLGQDYLRVKIGNATNTEIVNQFQEILSKLFNIYTENFDKIVKEYQQFIPNFGKDKTKPSSTKTVDISKIPLKNIAPQIFLPGYPKTCSKQPIIVSEEKEQELINEGIPVMKYPMSEDEGFGIPRNYVCKQHPTHPFPGLIRNPFPQNNDIVPFLPCCFEKDQSTKVGNPYGVYFKGEESKQGANLGQQDFIITNKFLEYGYFGNIPALIDNTLKIFDEEVGYRYLRKGVMNSKSSFLECIIEATEPAGGIFNVIEDDTDRIDYVKEVRQDLRTNTNIALCKQTMYDFTSEEIKEIIENDDKYFDPYYFIPLLEHEYGCNIYVFKRDKTGSNLIIPRNLQSYYKTYKSKPCVLIYEHMGSESNRAEFPMCELIIKWKKTQTDDWVSLFDSDSNLCLGLRHMFNAVKQAYVLNIKLTETDFPFPLGEFKITSQYIDSYGKCRMLRFTDKTTDKSANLLTSPIAPLAVVEMENFIIQNPITSDVAIQIAAKLGMIITRQNVVNNKVQSFEGTMGNVQVILPIIPAEITTEGIPIVEKSNEYPVKYNSTLTEYNTYKKLSRYITAYVFWLYSKYLYENKLEISIKTIDQFQNSNITINPNFVYGPVGKKFSMTSGVMKQNKLVLKSEEALKRLMYVLRINCRDINKILNYHTRTVIENYYLDITDFDQYQFQVILQGEDSVEKWILQKKVQYFLYDSVQETKLTPYFFRNKLIDKRISLAQNTNSLQNAFKIIHTWLTQHYNPVDPDQEKDPSVKDFTLYLYENKDTIAVKVYGNKKLASNYKILGYKIDQISAFTVLLPLTNL
jgi:hypothetical protein